MADFTAGQKVRAADLNALASYEYFTQGTVNTAWASTSYAWSTGLGAKNVIDADGVARQWGATCAVNVAAGPAWWRFRVDLAAGNGKAATTTYWPNTTGFRMAPPAGSELGFALQAGGSLLGDQAATLYLEARAEVANQPNVIIPTVRLGAYAN